MWGGRGTGKVGAAPRTALGLSTEKVVTSTFFAWISFPNSLVSMSSTLSVSILTKANDVAPPSTDSTQTFLASKLAALALRWLPSGRKPQLPVLARLPRLSASPASARTAVIALL